MQKGYKQTNLGVLAEGKVCVTMGCGKKAVPETRGVPEGLCYSWASRSLGHYFCLEACLVRGLEAFRIEPAAWWLLVQECILSIVLQPSHPALLRAAGAGAGRMHGDFFC